MASKDLEKLFYNDTIKLDYRDKAHRYYVSELQGDWTKPRLTKGVTTMMDKVLEKSGLMTWPMGLALRELFGFYNFVNEDGEKMIGFSKGVGTGWSHKFDPAGEDTLKLILSASKAWQRKKQTGADIGDIVHEAIENFVLGKPFEITLERYKLGQEFESPLDEHEWDKKAASEVAMANLAFAQFKLWWNSEQPELVGAEQLVYSRSMDYAGTFDAILTINGKTVLTDWKTSNASKNKEAAAPQGVYYSYFIQSAAYADAWNEMGNGLVDDLLIVSCRKDGGFDTVSASELGLSVEDCIKAWRCIHGLYEFVTATKKQLVNNVKKEEKV